MIFLFLGLDDLPNIANYVFYKKKTWCPGDQEMMSLVSDCGLSFSLACQLPAMSVGKYYLCGTVINHPFQWKFMMLHNISSYHLASVMLGFYISSL